MIILLLILAYTFVAFIVLAIVLRLPPIRWASISALLSPIQIHTIPIASIFPSISFLAGLASVKSVIQIRRHKFVWLYSFLFLEFFRLVSIGWSPNIAYGIRNFFYEIVFLFVFLAFADEKTSLSFKEKIITYTLFLSGINAFLVILFRLLPEVEGQFLHSLVARLFISPNVLDGLFSYSLNNVLDPRKSGGFFVNANVSAAYLGFSSMAAIYFGKAFNSKLLSAIGIFIWASVFFTGSKSAAIIAVLLPIVVTYIHLFITTGLTLKNITVIVWLSMFLAVVAFIAKIFLENSTFGMEASSTLHTRFIVWEFARISFMQHPFMGLGFGGWENGMASYAYLNGFRISLPAHNAILILWSQSGLLAAFCAILFLVSLIANLIKAMKYKVGKDLVIVKGILAGFLWVSIQAMGENFGIIGEAHITPLLGMLLGYAVSVGCFDFPKKSI